MYSLENFFKLENVHICMLTGMSQKMIKGIKTRKGIIAKQCSLVDEQRWNPMHRWKTGIKKEKIVSPLMAVGGWEYWGEAG